MAVAHMISSDSHVIEPPDLWSDRVPAHLRERAPQVVTEDDGSHWWYVDGRKTMSFLGIQTGLRFDKDPTKLRVSATVDQVRPAAFDPAAYIEENEQVDGVWGQVLYPSQGLVLFSIPDSELLSATMRAYNDWLAEFIAGRTDRMKGIGMVNVDDVADGVKELQRCHELGLSGALITVKPPAWAPFRDRRYDDFWAVASDLSMPLSLHTATDRSDPRDAGSFKLDVRDVPPAVFFNKDFAIREALADLIFSGVFERFPDLRIGAVEFELAWAGYFLDQMDSTYLYRPIRGEWHRFPEGTLPSDYFHRNVFCSFQEDAIGVRLRDVIGVEGLMWGSDYPHTEATFPRSKEIVEEVLAGVPDAEQALIARDNCARLYGFTPPVP
jgi:predicted TIM-barrel fold metal-dependent hydrolase